jgi:hypothetical protein
MQATKTGAHMSLIKKADVENYFVSRRNKNRFLSGLAKAPSVDISGTELARISGNAASNLPQSDRVLSAAKPAAIGPTGTTDGDTQKPQA